MSKNLEDILNELPPERREKIKKRAEELKAEEEAEAQAKIDQLLKKPSPIEDLLRRSKKLREDIDGRKV